MEDLAPHVVAGHGVVHSLVHFCLIIISGIFIECVSSVIQVASFQNTFGSSAPAFLVAEWFVLDLT